MIEETTLEIDEYFEGLPPYLQLAIKKGSVATIRAHLNPEHNKRAILCKAAYFGHLDIVKLLVEEFDTNIRAFGDYVFGISALRDHASICVYFHETVGDETEKKEVYPGDEPTFPSFDFDEDDEEEEEIKPEEKEQIDTDWKQIFTDAINVNRHPLEVDEIEQDLERGFATLEKLVEIYPEDDGLFYVQSYMKIFEPSTTDEQTEDAEAICTFFKTRRDAPQFVRARLHRYLQIIEVKDHHPIMAEKSKTLHAINLTKLQQFKASNPEYYKLAADIIYNHYERELNGETVFYLTRDGYAQSDTSNNMVTWYDEGSLRRHHKKLGEANAKFVGKILQENSIKPKITIADEAIFDRLEEEFPNFKEVIRYYKAQFRLLEETSKHRINPILLLGSPGIGKSLFTKKLTEALKTTMTYIDLSATTTGWLLSGMSVIWSTPKAGKIVEAMMNSPTVNPIVVLDEIEKPNNPDHDPKASLYQLLEENTARVFIDEFVEHPIDCSGVIYIACANGIEGIPEPLLTRFKVFDIPSPNREEKTSICQRIYTEATGGSALFSQTIGQSLVDGLMDKSLREAKQHIADAVGRALLEYTKEELKEMKFNGDVIEVQARHMNLPQQEAKKKFGF
ncbi:MULTISPECIES: AAA family ATPase [Burkholderia cepacia complex]|uniref:AAA family ATPase n=1 Tax=Burkholderia cepacia complex TaxID=87882 RepID=UPI0020A07843|nr:MULTISPECIES: AAA family ATPase [Burkholderia cepacia complex]MCO8395341.1 AAA family ATPase [Burkholderia cenocepacia]MCO8403210.1 AAA family ATPase [Burkholderia cenocepacia]MCO8416946.1 AAA family ATPase [Burkholderia cenocepacia]MCO8449327.1 AAA family ATPase [Burkholderia cenocepacia]MCO8455011.1 AAA family ATPase [Burkholderia multivorans]